MRVLNKIEPNEYESLQWEAFDVIQPIINQITIDSYEAGECGDTLKYKALIGAGNRIYSLIYYMMILRKRLNEIPEDTHILDKLDCILNGLRCYSTKVNIDLVSIFEELIDIFDLDQIDIIEEDDCCKGIGEMVINEGECDAFIIGECGEVFSGDYNNDYNEDFNTNE